MVVWLYYPIKVSSLTGHIIFLLLLVYPFPMALVHTFPSLKVRPHSSVYSLFMRSSKTQEGLGDSNHLILQGTRDQCLVLHLSVLPSLCRYLGCGIWGRIRTVQSGLRLHVWCDVRPPVYRHDEMDGVFRVVVVDRDFRSGNKFNTT